MHFLVQLLPFPGTVNPRNLSNLDKCDACVELLRLDGVQSRCEGCSSGEGIQW